MIDNKDINNIIDEHYANAPMIDTEENSEDVYDTVPKHLQHLSEDRLDNLRVLFRDRM